MLSGPVLINFQDVDLKDQTGPCRLQGCKNTTRSVDLKRDTKPVVSCTVSLDSFFSACLLCIKCIWHFVSLFSMLSITYIPELYQTYFTLPVQLLHKYRILIFVHNYVYHRTKLPIVFSSYL